MPVPDGLFRFWGSFGRVLKMKNRVSKPAGIQGFPMDQADFSDMKISPI